MFQFIHFSKCLWAVENGEVVHRKSRYRISNHMVLRAYGKQSRYTLCIKRTLINGYFLSLLSSLIVPYFNCTFGIRDILSGKC